MDIATDGRASGLWQGLQLEAVPPALAVMYPRHTTDLHRHLGRFQRDPLPDEIALNREEAVRVAADLRRLAAVAMQVLYGRARPPAGAPHLGGGAYYLKLALLVEGRLTIRWRDEAWLERALVAYRPLLDAEAETAKRSAQVPPRQ